MSYLTQEFFSRNRQNLTHVVESDLIVVASNGQLQKNASTAYKFAQDSNFYYLTGIEDPNMLLVIDSKYSEEYLISPQQTDRSVVFDGEPQESQIALRSGIVNTFGNKEGWLKLNARLASSLSVATIEPPEQYIEHYSFFTNPARAMLVDAIKGIKDIEIEDITKPLAESRVIKDPQEIAAMRSAVDHTVDMFNMLDQKIASYEHEYEIEADILYFLRSRGLDSPPYNCIVASGVNACTLHYTQCNSKIKPGLPILIDAAAQVEHYSADITRTFIPADTFTEQVHQAVQDIQQKAFNIIKPGLNFMEYERQMTKIEASALKDLGLIQSTLTKEVGRFCPHAKSHYLGLDTHDLGEHNQEFRPGMVITVEPGIYIADKKIGIRIEDDVLITDDGIENLSKNLNSRLSTLN